MRNILPEHVIEHFLKVDNKDETVSHDLIQVIVVMIVMIIQWHHISSLNFRGSDENTSHFSCMQHAAFFLSSIHLIISCFSCLFTWFLHCRILIKKAYYNRQFSKQFVPYVLEPKYLARFLTQRNQLQLIVNRIILRNNWRHYFLHIVHIYSFL